jgi:hypothetical protein
MLPLLRTSILASGLATGLGLLVHPLLELARQRYLGWTVYWYPPVLGQGHAWLWGVAALLPGLVLGLILPGVAGRRWPLRVGAVLVAAGAAALLLDSMVSTPSAGAVARVWSTRGALAWAAVAGALVGLGRGAEPSLGPSRRALVALVALLLTSAAATPDLLRVFDEGKVSPRARLQAQHLELVAAYRPWSNVVMRIGRAERVTWAGQPFQLDRSDRLRLGRGDVTGVGWNPDPPGVVLALTSRAAGQLRDRCVRRMSQHDALLVDGRLRAMLHHEILPDQQLLVAWPRTAGQAAARALYRSLTGRRRGTLVSARTRTQ